MRTIVVSSIAALALSACASDMGMSGENTYGAQQRRLTEDCRAKGGILTPAGQTTGRPQTDYVCEIRNEPARAAPRAR